MVPVIYLISLILFGSVIVKKWFAEAPFLLFWSLSFLFGAGAGVPVTYVFSSLLAATGKPIEWGVGLFMVLTAALLRKQKIRWRRVSWEDIGFVLCAVLFSTWLMMKTFRGDASGHLFVGSNNVFDFGFAIGLIRSISWGSNLPFMSPFTAGSPMFYHYMFVFWAAIWEYFGIPIVWAMNIPSILSFSALLVMVYFLPQVLWRQSKRTGWIAALLTVTNPTMTFWYMLGKTNLWRLAAYPFAGPYDGSSISVYMTLNNYVNQRHLAFSIALSAALLFIAVRIVDKKVRMSIFPVGIVSGILIFWNIPIAALTGCMLAGILLLKRAWKFSWLYAVGFLLGASVYFLPLVLSIGSVFSFIRGFIAAGMREAQQASPHWTAIEYWWNNLGLLPFLACAGYVAVVARRRFILVPFIGGFIVLCGIAIIGHRGFDQKFLSFLIIMIQIMAAIGIEWIFEKGRWAGIAAAAVLIFILTVSGFVDLMVIKNEFAYPLIDNRTTPVISWIRTATSKDAVFVSYSDMIDPVVLAGRTNYFGFYGNVGWFDRSADVSKIYQGDTQTAKANHISYILVPKRQKNDFPYVVDEPVLRSTYPVAYEDKNIVIFGMGAL